MLSLKINSRIDISITFKLDVNNANRINRMNRLFHHNKRKTCRMSWSGSIPNAPDLAACNIGTVEAAAETHLCIVLTVVLQLPGTCSLLQHLLNGIIAGI